MARIRPISNPNIPIPNNPFYSSESNYIDGVSGPFIVGSGLSINNVTGVISASGGGGGGAVSSIIAAAGISITPGSGTGNVTVSNTGVLSVTAGSGISVSAATGNITISSTSGATVSNVIGTAPISVANGTTTPNITVDTATTTNSGVTTLVNNLVTDDSTKALTAAQGKSLQDQINALAVSGTIELAGTVDAALGLVASVTSVGAADGYVVGSALPLPSSTTNNTYVIVTTPGTLTPPGGAPTPATRGDWFLVSEVTPGNYQWTFLNVGFDAPPASDTVAGIVELATNVETQTGTDSTRAVTPAAAAATYVPLSTLTAKGTLIAGQAASSPVALPVGTIGQVLQVDPTTTSGLKWVTPPAGCTGTVTQVGTGAALSGGPITTTGVIDLVVQGIAAGNYSNPSITVNCYGVITGISSGTSGIPCACITAKGDIIAGLSANTPTALPVGSDGQILVAASAAATGLCWVTAPAPAIPCACITAKGDLIVGASANTPVRLGVGTNGQVLTACSTAPNGVCWGLVPLATPTCQGTVLGRVDLGSGGLGFQALNSLTTGNYNVGIGENAGCSITSGCRNVAIGTLAVSTTTTASDNIGIGAEALRRNTSGCRNVAIGTTSLAFNTTGTENVVAGYDAQRANTTGSGNVALGTNALRNSNSGINNVSIGTNSGFNSLNSGSVFIGTSAGCNATTGSRQVLVGEFAGICLTSGGCNTAVGWSALPFATGSDNIAIGCNAGSNITTGSGNVAIGSNSTVGNATLSNQLALGNGAVTWFRGDGNGATCTYGSFVVKGTGAANAAGLANSDTFFTQDASYGPVLNFGNTFGGGKTFIIFRTNGIEVGTVTAVGTTGVSYQTTSDYRLKENVKDLEGGTAVLRRLSVREYNFISDPETVQQGFLAHELQEFIPQAVSGKKDEVDEDGNPKYQGVDFGKVVPILVAALKESIARIDTLEAKVKDLETNG